jgi:hypothetical protein
MAVPYNDSPFTSPLAEEVEHLHFSEGVREGGKLQTLIVPLTPLPNPPPQGRRESNHV